MLMDLGGQPTCVLVKTSLMDIRNTGELNDSSRVRKKIANVPAVYPGDGSGLLTAEQFR